MSDQRAPTAKVIQAMREGRLFWLESMANQSKLDLTCPGVAASVYLYLFDLRSLEAVRQKLPEALSVRVSRLLLLDDASYGDTTEPLQEEELLSEHGRTLFEACLDAFEQAFDHVDGEELCTGADIPGLVRYFAMRLRLHWHLGPPSDLPVPDKLGRLNDGHLFCVLCFHLERENNQHAVAKVDTLYGGYRDAGHIFWLLYLIQQNDNHLDRAKGYWLFASVMPHFDGNLLEERGLLFEGAASAPVRGLRATRRSYLYGAEDLSDPATASMPIPGFITDELDAIKQRTKPALARKRALTQHVRFKPYKNLDVDAASYVSPEDFLRTFVFFFPPVDPVDVALAVSGIKHGAYVFENLPALVSRSLAKLDPAWPDNRELGLVRDNAAFIRRVWRSYESGVYKIPPRSSVIAFQKDLEHWDFIRQVWPKAKRILIAPGADGASLVEQLHLSLDADTDALTLERAQDWRGMARRLGLAKRDFGQLRQRTTGWAHILTPELI